MLHFLTQLATDITEFCSLVISFVCLSQPINLSFLFADNIAANQSANVRGFYFSDTKFVRELGILCYDAIMLLSEM